jgi:L-lactate dehydrogenase complex protein LldF
MNTCPIYRRSGGHSYDYTIPGPIGSILSPNVDMKEHSSLPFASTLCGSCSDVCPVKIDIHTQLYKWRQIIAKEGYLPASKRWSMRMTGWLFAHPRVFRFSGRMGRKLLSLLPRKLVNNPLNTWGKERELPAPPKTSFRDWYIKNRKNGKQ